MKGSIHFFILVLLTISVSCCQKSMPVTETVDRQPVLFPDYTGVTIPQNIAPLDFCVIGEDDYSLAVKSEGMEFLFKSKDGAIRFGMRKWRRMTAQCAGKTMSWAIVTKKGGKYVSYKPFEVKVTEDAIDPFISYRLIPPGYQGWKRMGLYQRDLRKFKQSPVIENKNTEENCLNCHTPCGQDASKTVFHARADFGGTFIIDGGSIEKLNTKTDSTISALVYPYWHPSGDLIAFSVNNTLQAFFNHDPDRIEVYDSASDVVVYDVDKHEIFWSPETRSEDYFETFPTFSPDGRWLYFCAAKAIEPMPERYKDAKYALYRIAFNKEDCSFGDCKELIFDAPAEGKSVSFPRISPDGKYMAFTEHEYGNFSIWHKDADIKILNLETMEFVDSQSLNSVDVESYHCWSSSGRWMVFSSRRDDGLYTKLYFAHMDDEGRISKPFLLPQRNPEKYYTALMFSFNIPEFMNGKVSVSKSRIVKEIRKSKGTDIGIKTN